ncbi:MAG TPA: nucleotidyltransferase domain-containing protein [Acidimicrobiia bacterium]|nr:nucleotidyltransferase domain-containing protein [Acidimicrobiia bacterium]
MEILRTLRDSAASVFDGEPVAFAYLFGSQTRGTARPDSDVDVAVYLEDGNEEDPLDISFRLAGELERTSGVGAIEAVVVLNTAPLPLAGRVISDGRLIYTRDEPRRVRYESLIFRQFTDFDRMARILDEEMIQSHARGTR